MSLITKSPAGISLIQSLLELHNERQIELTPTKKKKNRWRIPSEAAPQMTGSVIYLNISVTFYTLSEVKATKRKRSKWKSMSLKEINAVTYFFFSPPESPWAYNGTKQNKKNPKKHKWERNQKWLVVTAPRLQETGSDLRIFHLECLLPAFSSLLLFLTSDVLRRSALTLSDSVFFCFFPLFSSPCPHTQTYSPLKKLRAAVSLCWK